MTFRWARSTFAKNCRTWRQRTEFSSGKWPTFPAANKTPSRVERHPCTRRRSSPVRPGTRSVRVSIPTETASAEAATCRCSSSSWRASSTRSWNGPSHRRSAWSCSIKTNRIPGMWSRPSGLILLALPSVARNKKWMLHQGAPRFYLCQLYPILHTVWTMFCFWRSWSTLAACKRPTYPRPQEDITGLLLSYFYFILPQSSHDRPGGSLKRFLFIL